MNREQIKVLESAGIVWGEVEGLEEQPRATYYKPNGEALPNLPSDVYSLPRYLARGFTLKPPVQAPPALPENKCETCGKVVSTKLALAGHMRSHEKDTH